MGHYTIDAAAIAALPGTPSVDAPVHQVAETIFDESQAIVPVDTGHLKQSGFTDGNNSEYRIGYTADYARYVEFGTSEMNAEPYLTPAALKNRGSL